MIDPHRRLTLKTVHFSVVSCHKQYAWLNDWQAWQCLSWLYVHTTRDIATKKLLCCQVAFEMSFCVWRQPVHLLARLAIQWLKSLIYNKLSLSKWWGHVRFEIFHLSKSRSRSNQWQLSHYAAVQGDRPCSCLCMKWSVWTVCCWLPWAQLHQS